MLILNMSGAYEGQEWFFTASAPVLDFKGLPGTNCYLSEDTKEVIKEKLKEYPLKDIHMIDSGNYHYISLLFLERIEEDFSLILFDNHPDMQRPAFDGVISCGGWVLAAKETLPNLKNIYIIGAEEELLEEELSEGEDAFLNVHYIKDRSSVTTDDYLELLKNDPLKRFYISIDKDVLSPEYAKCNWSQGIMTPEEIMGILNGLKQAGGVSFIGADICGEDEMPQNTLNSKVNMYIINELAKILSL